MTQEALKLALETLKNNKPTHLYCEDPWYSCPKHEDGCANKTEGDECNCGADEINAEFDKAITAIKEALAQEQEQEPVAMLERDPSIGRLRVTYEDAVTELDEGIYPLYTKPQGWPVIDKSAAIRIATVLGWKPPRTWVGLTDEEFQWVYDHGRTPAGMMEMIEAKLKQKNGYAEEKNT